MGNNRIYYPVLQVGLKPMEQEPVVIPEKKAPLTFRRAAHQRVMLLPVNKTSSANVTGDLQQDAFKRYEAQEILLGQDHLAWPGQTFWKIRDLATGQLGITCYTTETKANEVANRKNEEESYKNSLPKPKEIEWESKYLKKRAGQTAA